MRAVSRMAVSSSRQFSRRATRWWQAVGLYAVVMAVFAVAPLPEQPLTPVGPLDKMEHVCEYALFAWGLAHAARLSAYSTTSLVLVAMIAPMLYGGVLEVVQAFIPYRSAEWGDVAADVLGVMMGFVIGSWRHGG